jgi:hypothetical protein
MAAREAQGPLCRLDHLQCGSGKLPLGNPNRHFWQLRTACHAGYALPNAAGFGHAQPWRFCECAMGAARFNVPECRNGLWQTPRRDSRTGSVQL